MTRVVYICLRCEKESEDNELCEIEFETGMERVCLACYRDLCEEIQAMFDCERERVRQVVDYE